MKITGFRAQMLITFIRKNPYLHLLVFWARNIQSTPSKELAVNLRICPIALFTSYPDMQRAYSL